MKWMVAAACLVIVPVVDAAQNEIIKNAKEVGITTCAKTLDTLSDFALKDSPHTANNTWHKSAPNKHFYDSHSLKGYVDGQSQISLTVSPNATGGCDAVLLESMVFPKSCVSVRETTFSTWKFKDEASGTVVLRSEKGAVNIYLTPAANNTVCLVGKKEIIYQ